jgi:hypothetical protein
MAALTSRGKAPTTLLSALTPPAEAPIHDNIVAAHALLLWNAAYLVNRDKEQGENGKSVKGVSANLSEPALGSCSLHFAVAV